MGDQLMAIVQAGVYAVLALLATLLCIGVLLLLSLVSRWFSPKNSKSSLEGEEDNHNDQESKKTQALDNDTPVDYKKKIEEFPIDEKYPQIYRFEILYWRGVSKPWWWNNYAKDLVAYADEYFPTTKVSLYATYNSNSKSNDYQNPSYQKRIQSLRPKKISKHPLVVINYSQEYIMVDSYPALEAMKDRIDAEWYRHYRFKKTYRDSPVTFTR